MGKQKAKEKIKVRELLGEDFSYNELRLARLFLGGREINNFYH